MRARKKELKYNQKLLLDMHPDAKCCMMCSHLSENPLEEVQICHVKPRVVDKFSKLFRPTKCRYFRPTNWKYLKPTLNFKAIIPPLNAGDCENRLVHFGIDFANKRDVTVHGTIKRKGDHFIYEQN